MARMKKPADYVSGFLHTHEDAEGLKWYKNGRFRISVDTPPSLTIKMDYVVYDDRTRKTESFMMTGTSNLKAQILEALEKLMK